MTAESTNPRLPLRRLPAPAWEPAYDDELAGAGAPVAVGRAGGGASDAVQGTLALAFVLPSGLPATPDAPARGLLRLVPAPAPPGRRGERGSDRRGGAGGRPSTVATGTDEEGDDEEADDPEFAAQPTSSAALPEPRRWAGQLVQALVEVVSGERPLAQLVRWTTTDVYAQVQERVARAAPTPARSRAGQLRAVVRSVHVSEPRDGVAEACARVQRGTRCLAVALRLEGIDGRWQCTALEFP